MTTRRPTAADIETARALARYHADQVQQHERNATGFLGALLVACACLCLWVLL
jgi:hypothetical protein